MCIRDRKDAVYQMIDATATEIVSDPDKFRAYLDTQARMAVSYTHLDVYKRQHSNRSERNNGHRLRNGFGYLGD